MRFLVLVFSLLQLGAGHAQSLPTTIPVPAVSARAWLLMDYTTGQVLAAQEADLKLEPAALTKVMTTYRVAEALENKTLTLTHPVPSA